MASIFSKLGGLWFFLIGAPLAAWFLIQFWLGPLLGISYSFNILTLLALSQPLADLLFVALWFGLSLGYFGAGIYHNKHHGK
jgi:hypothetical protein